MSLLAIIGWTALILIVVLGLFMMTSDVRRAPSALRSKVGNQIMIGIVIGLTAAAIILKMDRDRKPAPQSPAALQAPSH